MTADGDQTREDGAPIRVWLEVDLEGQPIEGTLSQPQRQPSRFTGWLGLTTALERLRTDRKHGNKGEP